MVLVNSGINKKIHHVHEVCSLLIGDQFLVVLINKSYLK